MSSNFRNVLQLAQMPYLRICINNPDVPKPVTDLAFKKCRIRCENIAMQVMFLQLLCEHLYGTRVEKIVANLFLSAPQMQFSTKIWEQ